MDGDALPCDRRPGRSGTRSTGGGGGLFEVWVTPIVLPGYHGPPLVATADVLVVGAAVLWRRRAPWLAMGVLVAVLAHEWAYARGVERVPNGDFGAVLLLAYTLGAHEERARGLIAMLAASGVS